MTTIESKVPANKRALTAKEKSRIDEFKEKPKKEIDNIFRAATKDDENKVGVSLNVDSDLEHSDAINLLHSAIAAATGSTNSTVGIQLLINLSKAIISSNASAEEIVSQLGTFAQSMTMLAPQDPYEGQLVAQLVVLHEQSMEWLGKAMRTERVDFANVYLNGASKLLTRHHETLDALLKYRRKGEQRVLVEHVHVHSGGQAIVGTITTGSGMNQKTEEGPHAKV